MVNGAVLILTKELPKPSHAVAPHDIICVNSRIQVRYDSNVSANYDRGVGLMLANQRAHFFHLFEVWLNCTNSNDIVLFVLEFQGETIQIRIFQQGAGRIYVCLDQFQADASF